MRNHLWTLLFLIAAGSASARHTRHQKNFNFREARNEEPEPATAPKVEVDAAAAVPETKSPTAVIEENQSSEALVVPEVSQPEGNEATKSPEEQPEPEIIAAEPTPAASSPELPNQHRDFEGNEVKELLKNNVGNTELHPAFAEKILNNKQTQIDVYYDDDGATHVVLRVPASKTPAAEVPSVDENTYTVDEDYEVMKTSPSPVDPETDAEEEVIYDVDPEIEVEVGDQSQDIDSEITVVDQEPESEPEEGVEVPDVDEIDTVEVDSYDDEGNEVEGVTVVPVPEPPTEDEVGDDVVVPVVVTPGEKNEIDTKSSGPFETTGVEEKEEVDVEDVTAGVIVTETEEEDEPKVESPPVVVISEEEQEKETVDVVEVVVTTEQEEEEEKVDETNGIDDLIGEALPEGLTDPSNYWWLILLIFCCFI